MKIKMRENKPSAPLSGQTAKGKASMDMIWTEAADAFKAICGESLEKGEVRSFDDVQKKIEKTCDNASDADSKPEDKWDVAKSVGLKSLRYLKLLVGVASQASSMIPIPPVAASITSTALCFVFDIPEAVKGYNDAIDSVFSEVSSALSQFQIYRSTEHLDPLLIKQIHLVLVSFVKICAHVVKYRQGRKRDRFWEQTKVILGENSDLDDEMKEFKRLLQGQRDVEGTVTLAVVLETKKDLAEAYEKIIIFGKISEETQKVVQETQKGVQSLNDDSDRTKTLTKIRNTLDVPSTVHLDTTTTQTRIDLCAKCLDNSGSWIWTHQAFLSWMAAKDKGVLVVSGPPSAGKTSVCALITKHLEEQKNRTYVGHYFFPASTKKSEDNKNSVHSCLKYIAFQIARVDAVVRKALGKVCDANPAVFRPSASVGLDALWKELKIGAAGSSATYYLVFDGIENLPEKQAEMLLKFILNLQLEKEQAGRVRVLVSGTENIFAKFLNTGGMLRIRMEKHNQDDMRLVIHEALNTQGILQNAKPNSEQEKAKNKILEKLPQKVDGSYSLLRLELDRVTRQLSKRTAVQELDRMLDQSISSHETAIRDLERSLTADEIAELNELLKWVMYGYYYMTLANLESAMVLFSDVASLTSLEYVIQTKYSAVLKIEEGNVYLQDGVEEYLYKSETSSGDLQRANDGATISMSISINNVERELCGHFLWDLADMAIRNQFKFNFDSNSLDTLHSSSQRAIAVNELESNHAIVSRAFKYLSNEPKDETWEIGSYLVTRLPFHLGRLRQLEDEDEGALRDDQKSEIGQYLYKIFRDDTVFKQHKATFQTTYWSATEINDLQTWLMDSTVVRKVDKKWRNGIRGASNPVKGYLKDLVRMVVQGLLRDRSWDVANAGLWLSHFIQVDENKVQQPPNTTTHEIESSSSSSSSSSPEAVIVNSIDWEHASKWCQEVLGLSDSELDSLWHERLAEASSSQGQDYNLTTSLYHQAIEKKNPSWRCYRGLGTTYHAQGSIKDAITQLELALDRATQEYASPEPENKDITEIHLLIGQYAYEIDDMLQAMKHYSTACESEALEQASQGQLGRLKASFSFQDAEDTRRVLKDTFSGDNEQTIIGFLKAMAWDFEHDFLIMSMLRFAKSDSELLNQIVRAIEVTTARLAPTTDHNADTLSIDDQYANDEARGVLLFAQGVAAYKFRVSTDGTEPTKEALRLWAESRDQLKKIGGPNAYITRYNATSALANHYFQEMMEKGLDKEQMGMLSEMIKDDFDQYNDCVGFLAALHVKNYNKDQAREVLGQRAKQALQILSDDMPENDRYGFDILFRTMAHYQDLENSAIALSLECPPDIVTSALKFSAQDFPNVNDEDKQQVLDMVTALTEDVINVTRSQVPDSWKQEQRVQAAIAHFKSLSTSTGSKKELSVDSDGSTLNQPDRKSKCSPGGNLVLSEACYQIIMDTLLKCIPEINKTVEQWDWSCDGCSRDGKRCRNLDNGESDFFHCLYCSDNNFCRECLTQLRDPDSDTINTCNPKHQWLLVPRLGDDMYVGSTAKSVRRPIVKAAEEDSEVFMISYAATDAEPIPVQVWKEEVAKEWGISLQELKDSVSRLSTPESDKQSGEEEPPID